MKTPVKVHAAVLCFSFIFIVGLGTLLIRMAREDPAGALALGISLSWLVGMICGSVLSFFQEGKQ